MNQDWTTGIITHPVYVYRDSKLCKTSQAVIREVMLEILLDGKQVCTIACLGEHLQDLALGFLLAEGYIERPGEIKDIRQHPQDPIVAIETHYPITVCPPPKGTCILTSGARTGRFPGKHPDTQPWHMKDLRIKPKQVLTLMDLFLEQCQRHALTGATHAAALADSERIGLVREDIGRHNCMDMLAGHLFRHGHEDSWPIIVRTGRVSEEIILKAARWPIAILSSLSVPTSRAIFLADSCGITLIGSVRHGSYKIYTHPHRVLET